MSWEDETDGYEWTRAFLGERSLDPISPLTWSIFDAALRLVPDILAQMGIKAPREGTYAKLIAGRPYVNQTLLLEAMKDIPGAKQNFLGGEGQMRPEAKLSVGMLPLLMRLLRRVKKTHKEWDEVLPPYLYLVERTRGTDWSKLEDGQLLEPLDEVILFSESIADIHILSILFAQATYRMLEDIARKHGGEEAASLVPALTSGMDGNKTVETNRELWKLSRLARGSEEIREALAHDDYRQRLPGSEAGTDFLRRFDAFLLEYGHRSPKYDIAHPCWAEAPGVVIGMMLAQAALDDDQSPGVKGAVVRQNRDAAEKEVLRLIRGPVNRAAFKWVLKYARIYMPLRENQQWYVGLMFPLVRQSLIELGRRLQAKGFIERPEDIFYLTIEEVRAAAASTAKPRMLLAASSQRKADYAGYEKMTPPMVIGSNLGENEPGASNKGVAASPGIVTARARVLHDMAEADLLQPGEILVTRTTNPSWTPLFSVASGLVTEVGGSLSHGAVVAREVGIPAVLGVPKATEWIETGQILRLDGSKGTVEVVEEDRAPES